MNPTSTAPTSPTPLPIPSPPPTINQNPPVSPKRFNKILLLIVLLTVAAVFLGIFYLTKPVSRLTPKPSASPLEIITQTTEGTDSANFYKRVKPFRITASPSSDISQSLQERDYDSILARIAQQTPGGDWILGLGNTSVYYRVSDLVGDLNSSHDSSSLTSGGDVQVYYRSSDLCLLLTENGCSKLPTDKFPVIFKDRLLSYQPYSAAATFMGIARSIYGYLNLKNSQTDSNDSCYKHKLLVLDETTWVAKYWSLLTPDQRDHLDQYPQTVSSGKIDRLEKETQAYQNNTLDDYVSKNLLPPGCQGNR